jgi:DNA-binding transcriptional LysR family regulator
VNFKASFNALRVKQLLLLVALDQHKSIRKAAEEIHVSQAAASKSLMALEAAMGCALFARAGNGLRATEAGLCATAYAQDMLHTLRRMRSDLDRVRQERQVLRIGTIMGAVPQSLITCLQRLRRTTSLQVAAEEGTSSELITALRAGRLDLIFGRSHEPATLTGIVSQMLGDETVCVVSSPLHPLVATRLATCEQLAQFPWIAYEPAAPLSHLLYEWLERQTGRTPDVRLQTASALITVSTVLATDFLALLPDSVFKALGSEGRLNKIRTNAALTLGRYFAYWPAQSQRLDLINLALDRLGEGDPCSKLEPHAGISF